MQIKSAAELRASSEEERQTYADKLKGLELYQKAQHRAALYGARLAGLVRTNWQRHNEPWLLPARLLLTWTLRRHFSANAMKGSLTEGALALVEQFTAIRRGGEDVGAALEGLGKKFDPRNADQLRDIDVTLQYLGQYGLASGEQIEEFLIAKLSKLSGEELVKVQVVAQQVFDGLGRGAAAAGLALDAGLNTVLAKLGLDLEGIKTGFDKVLEAIIQAFDGVVSAQAASGRGAEDSAKVITAAYTAARAKIDDPAALAKLDAAFKEVATRQRQVYRLMPSVKVWIRLGMA